MAEPLFSIITVTYNAAASVEPTLRSVKQQTFTDYEMLVQDGMSTDATLELVNQSGVPNLKVRCERDSGIYDAMNHAMDNTTGRYLIFLNAGDAFHSPDTLAHLARLIEQNDYPGIVYGQTDIVDSHRRRLGPRHLTAPERLTLESFRNGMLVCHQAFVALRCLTGPYDTSFRYSADYDWCVRCLQHSHKNVYAGEVIIDYLDEGMTTRHRGASLRERFRIMCRYYGAVRTSLRHIGFALRFARRSFAERAMRRSVK